jgi:hypothetical protein
MPMTEHNLEMAEIHASKNQPVIPDDFLHYHLQFLLVLESTWQEKNIK